MASSHEVRRTWVAFRVSADLIANTGVTPSVSLAILKTYWSVWRSDTLSFPVSYGSMGGYVPGERPATSTFWLMLRR